MSVTTHEPSTSATERVVSYADAINEAMAEEMERDETVFLMGQDIGVFGGVFAVTRGLVDRFGPDRVIDTPISETFIVGGAVGAAITGLRPVVELQFADFVSVAMDEIYNKAAKWRYMHGGLFEVPMVIRMPEGAAGGSGPEHSQCPEGLFLSAPGLNIVTPSTPADAKGLLKASIRDPNPVLFFEHKTLYKTKGPIPVGDHVMPLGIADIKRPGSDVTVVAWSAMVHAALEAAESLAQRSISVEVIDPRGFRPLDMDTILSSVQKTGRLVVAHEAAVVGSPANEVVAVVAEKGLMWLEKPIARVGAPDIPIPQSAHLERLIMPGVAEISAAIVGLIE